VFLSNIYKQIARLHDSEDHSPEQVMKCGHSFTILGFPSPIEFSRNRPEFLQKCVFWETFAADIDIIYYIADIGIDILFNVTLIHKQKQSRIKNMSRVIHDVELYNYINVWNQTD
jgi:hypothetical protein